MKPFRSRLKLPLALVVLALASTAPAADPADRASRPNILVIIADDVGYGDLSGHGNPVVRTPHLDQLRAESVRFTDFHSAPFCTPTRAQLMTGRDALATAAVRVTGGRGFIRPEVPTMAELFRRGGYRTGMFGKWHLGDNAPHRPHDRGFEVAKYHLGWGLDSAPDMENDYADGVYRDNGVVRNFTGFCTDFLFDEAMSWMRARHEQREPFFCYLPLNAAHGPFRAPLADAAPYAAHGEVLAGFYGLIANLDDNFGRLEAMLAQTGLRDNTIVVFVSDNGTVTGDKVFNAGMRGKKGELYEGGHRVPCFIRWPAGGLAAGRNVSGLTQMQDIVPTLLELSRQRVDVTFDGVSLAPQLRGKAVPSDRRLIVQLHAEHGNAAVAWERWRLVRGRELYDLVADPGQKEDVAKTHPAIVSELNTFYDSWWARQVPGLAEYVPIDIGTAREDPVVLSSADWQDAEDRFAGNSAAVRLVPGANRGAPWNLRVARAGEYEIALYRWPPAMAAALGASLPARPPAPGLTGRPGSAGRALPIARASLVVGGQQIFRDANPEEPAVHFRVQLPAGRLQLHGWFSDARGGDLCGAYFAVVRLRP